MSDNNQQQEEGRLTTAAYAGRIDEVRYLVNEKIVDVNEKDIYGDTALHASVAKGRLSLVKFLLEKGADVNAKNEAGSTPLHKAVLAKYDQLNIIRALVSNKVDINIRNGAGYLAEQYSFAPFAREMFLGDECVSEEVTISKAKHNKIIGKKGAKIEEIRLATGTHITIPDAADPSSIVTIKGRRSGITLAKELIQKSIAESEDEVPNDGKTSVRYPLAKDKHKIVVGRQGATINEIRDETGAEIIMPPADSEDAHITIRGDLDQIDAAIKLVQVKVDIAQRARRAQLQRDREHQQRDAQRSGGGSGSGGSKGSRGGRE